MQIELSKDIDSYELWFEEFRSNVPVRGRSPLIEVSSYPELHFLGIDQSVADSGKQGPTFSSQSYLFLLSLGRRNDRISTYYSDRLSGLPIQS